MLFCCYLCCSLYCLCVNVLYYYHRVLTQLQFTNIPMSIYRVSQEECARLREGVPYVKVYRYYPKHLCPKLNGYGDNGQRKVWSSCASTHCYPPLQTLLSQLTVSFLACGVKLLLVSRDKRLHTGSHLPQGNI